MKASKIRCLVTAGPTREYFDPVRFLSNPSSGKMGYALAEAAADAGWEVELVSGPVSLSEPRGVSLTRVITSDEMFLEVNRRFDDCDVLIMSAAVVDYRPVIYSEQKVKKSGDVLEVALEPVRDIVKTLTMRKSRQYVVAFAAETEDIEANARKKLIEKNVDIIVANEVGKEGSGFGSDVNRLTVVGSDGSARNLGPDTKKRLASLLIEEFSRNLLSLQEKRP